MVDIFDEWLGEELEVGISRISKFKNETLLRTCMKFQLRDSLNVEPDLRSLALK